MIEILGGHRKTATFRHFHHLRVSRIEVKPKEVTNVSLKKVFKKASI